MLESIAAPNRRIVPGYASENVFLLDGDVVAGRVALETEDRLVVVDAQGATTEVAQEDVEERRPGLSAMPEDLAGALSRVELRDLIAYLATL